MKKEKKLKGEIKSEIETKKEIWVSPDGSEHVLDVGKKPRWVGKGAGPTD